MKESLWIQLSLLYVMHIFVFFSMQPLVETWLQTQPPPEKQHPIDYPLDLSVSLPKKCRRVESASTDSDSMANDDNQRARIPASSRSHISVDFHEGKAYCRVSISNSKTLSHDFLTKNTWKNHENLNLKLAFSMSYNCNFMYF